MPVIIPIGGITPQRPAFLAANATLVGDVRFGPDCSVWFGAVLRGDINHVALGARCNVQDGCVLHVSKARPCVLGNDVSLGHGAIVHACTIGNGTLVGMRAVVLDGAQVGEGCLVAAGCVVGEGLVVPDGHLVAGVPGKVIGPLKDSTRARFAPTAANYVSYQALYPDWARSGGEASPC